MYMYVHIYVLHMYIYVYIYVLQRAGKVTTLDSQHPMCKYARSVIFSG